MGLIRYLFSKLKSSITVRKTTIYDIDRMDGIEFEKYSASLLEKLGYNNVKVTQSSNDYGIDIICSKNGKKYAIQCKRYANKLGNSPVQEATAGKRYYNCDIGVVLTNNYFTENAINLANANGVLLWDRDMLTKMIRKANKAKQKTTQQITPELQHEQHITNNEIIKNDIITDCIREINEVETRIKSNNAVSEIVDIDSNYSNENSYELYEDDFEYPDAEYQLPSIEIFNSDSVKYKNTVRIYDLLDTFEFMSSKFLVCLGKDIDNNCVYCDIIKMPHLLISGSTGSGKSICMHSIISSILCKLKPNEVKFLMIDPKKIEFLRYEKIPHLLVPIITDSRKASGALGWSVSEMLMRYQKFSDTGVRDIDSYNNYANEHNIEIMPRILICIDGLEILMSSCPIEIEDSICRLTQMARTAGIHLIITTQQEKVIKKANINSTIKTNVISMNNNSEQSESYQLLYKQSNANHPMQIKGCFVLDEDINRMCEFIISQENCYYSHPITKELETEANGFLISDIDNEILDPLFEEAVDVILNYGKASISFLQRKLGVSYLRGSKIMDQLEEKRIVGPQYGSNPREILINKQLWNSHNF